MLRKLFCLGLWMVIYSSLSTAWGIPSNAGALLPHGAEEELTEISTQLSAPTAVSCKRTTFTPSNSSLRPGKWAKVALPLVLMASVLNLTSYVLGMLKKELATFKKERDK